MSLQTATSYRFLKRTHADITVPSHSLAKRWRHYTTYGEGFNAELVCISRIFALLVYLSKSEKIFGPVTRYFVSSIVCDYKKYMKNLFAAEALYSKAPTVRQLQQQILMNRVLRHETYIEKLIVYLCNVVRPSLRDRIEIHEFVDCRNCKVPYSTMSSFLTRLTVEMQGIIDNLNEELGQYNDGHTSSTMQATVKIAAVGTLEKVIRDITAACSTSDSQRHNHDLIRCVCDEYRTDPRDRCFEIWSDLFDKHGHLIMNHCKEKEVFAKAGETPQTSEQQTLSFLDEINIDFWL